MVILPFDVRSWGNSGSASSHPTYIYQDHLVCVGAMDLQLLLTFSLEGQHFCRNALYIPYIVSITSESLIRCLVVVLLKE